MLSQILTFLSWLALPVGLIVILDDWFVRPQRQIVASPQPPRDPGMMRLAYMVLPLFIAAAVLRLLMAERLDFSSVLFGITALTGVVQGDGTAVQAFAGFPLSRIPVAGKTGTAEVNPFQPYSWL